MGWQERETKESGRRKVVSRLTHRPPSPKQLPFKATFSPLHHPRVACKRYPRIEASSDELTFTSPHNVWVDAVVGIVEAVWSGIGGLALDPARCRDGELGAAARRSSSAAGSHQHDHRGPDTPRPSAPGEANNRGSKPFPPPFTRGINTRGGNSSVILVCDTHRPCCQGRCPRNQL